MKLWKKRQRSEAGDNNPDSTKPPGLTVDSLPPEVRAKIPNNYVEVPLGR